MSWLKFTKLSYATIKSPARKRMLICCAIAREFAQLYINKVPMDIIRFCENAMDEDVTRSQIRAMIKRVNDMQPNTAMFPPPGEERATNSANTLIHLLKQQYAKAPGPTKHVEHTISIILDGYWLIVNQSIIDSGDQFVTRFAKKFWEIHGPIVADAPDISDEVLVANDHAATKIAQQIYNSQAYAELPYLWDALEDAGCSNTLVHAHCHSNDQHFKGCWLLDKILKKE